MNTQTSSRWNFSHLSSDTVLFTSMTLVKPQREKVKHNPKKMQCSASMAYPFTRLKGACRAKTEAPLTPFTC